MIFILGGRGLVGSAFARVCEASGRPYAILDRGSYADYAGQHCELLINANGNSLPKRTAPIDTVELGF
jgi:nucleoside-diphosphate-sugar epimerase